jgi:hypothetical protein
MTVSRLLGLTALLPLRQSGAGYELSWTPWLEPGVATQAGVGPGYRDCLYHNPSCGLLDIHRLLRSHKGEIVNAPDRRKPMEEQIIATYCQ